MLISVASSISGRRFQDIRESDRSRLGHTPVEKGSVDTLCARRHRMASHAPLARLPVRSRAWPAVASMRLAEPTVDKTALVRGRGAGLSGRSEHVTAACDEYGGFLKPLGGPSGGDLTPRVRIRSVGPVWLVSVDRQMIPGCGLVTSIGGRKYNLRGASRLSTPLLADPRRRWPHSARPRGRDLVAANGSTATITPDFVRNDLARLTSVE